MEKTISRPLLYGVVKLTQIDCPSLLWWDIWPPPTDHVRSNLGWIGYLPTPPPASFRCGYPPQRPGPSMKQYVWNKTITGKWTTPNSTLPKTLSIMFNKQHMVHFSQYRIPQETFIFVTNVTNGVVLFFSSLPTIFHREHFQFIYPKNVDSSSWDCENLGLGSSPAISSDFAFSTVSTSSKFAILK